MMAKYTFLFFLLLSSLVGPQAVAQTLIFSDSTLNNFSDRYSRLGGIDINTCRDTIYSGSNVYRKILDLTVLANKDLFASFVLNNGNNDTLMHRRPFPYTQLSPLWVQANNLNSEVRGLTCDEYGFVYAAGKGISKRETVIAPPYDEIYLGDLPSDMKCTGDITYIQGKFYLVASGNRLVKVNMKDISKSTVVYTFPSGTLPIQGLTTVQTDCNVVKTYAVGSNSNHSIFYHLDLDRWELTQVCDVPRTIESLGNETECALPSCNVFIDLDEDNSSVGYYGHFSADTFCLPPVAIADDDVQLIATGVDSIELRLTGVLNGSFERLQSNLILPTINVVGNNSQRIMLYNAGTASLADFEATIKSIEYDNLAPVFNFGTRTVEVRGWHNGQQSIVSTAELPFGNDFIDNPTQIIRPTCNYTSDGQVSVQPTGGTGPYTFQWQNGESDTFLTNLGGGTYYYSYTDASGCYKADSVVVVPPDSLIVTIRPIGNGGATCLTSGALAGIRSGGVYPLQAVWSNGVMGFNNINLAAGNYSITITDSRQCSAADQFTIVTGDTVLVQRNESVCKDGTFILEGVTYNRDTSFCNTYLSSIGCDSTFCFQFTVFEDLPVEIQSTGNLCEGGTVTLTATPGFTYVWDNGTSGTQRNITQPGDYRLTVTDSRGCTKLLIESVKRPVTLDYEVVSPVCPNDSEGQIQIKVPINGTPPYLYSIDSVLYYEDNVFSNLSTGDYWLSIIDGTDCRLVEKVTLQPTSQSYLSAGPDLYLPLGQEVSLQAVTNVASVQWSPSDFLNCSTCFSTTAAPLEDIEYVVSGVAEDGCFLRDTIRLYLVEGKRVFIPNVFSPNNDGTNDTFTIFSDQTVESISMEIYDNWGKRVFIVENAPPNDFRNSWDGRTLDGNEPNPGTFTYIIQAEFIDGTTQEFIGTVILVR